MGTTKSSSQVKADERKHAEIEQLINRVLPAISEYGEEGRENEPDARRKLAEELIKKDIPRKDLEPYLRALADTDSTAYCSRYQTYAAIQEKDRIRAVTMIILTKAVNSLAEAELLQEQAHKWRERFLTDQSESTIRKMATSYIDTIKILVGAHLAAGTAPRPNLSLDDLRKHFEVAIEVYAYIFSSPENLKGESSKYLAQAVSIGVGLNSPEQASRILRLFKEMPVTDTKVQEDFLHSVVHQYSGHHLLTDDSTRSLIDKLLPAFKTKDDQIAILTSGHNIFAGDLDAFGIGDFIVHCYAVRVTPPNINELLMIMSQVPGTNLSRLKQNRVDAPALSGLLKETVHDERPYVHELIKAMASYYSTNDKKELDAAFTRAADYERSLGRSGYGELVNDLLKEVQDRPFYEREVLVKEHNAPEKAVDVLMRLLKNTEPEVETPPSTSDPELNERMARLVRSGSVYDTPLERALTYVNDKLEAMMEHGEAGIEPNLISIISWLDRQGDKKLQSLTYEDQLSAYDKPWFISILKFQELTASPNGFDQAEFERFVGQVKKAETMQDAYRLIAQRTLENVSGLSENYKARKLYGADTWWSGSIARQLIGLTELREASTNLGQSALKKEIRRRTEQDYHPGD